MSTLLSIAIVLACGLVSFLIMASIVARGPRYCRVCLERDGREVTLYGVWQIFKHIWVVHKGRLP